MCFTSEFRQVHHTVILCCLPFRWHIPCCHGNWCRVEKELTAVITDKQMIQEETACASLIKGSWCLVEQWINLLWWRNRTENIWHSLRKYWYFVTLPLVSLWNVVYNNNNKILLKIGKITNYITFPPANSLWTNRGGGSWRHITKQELYIDGLNNSEDTTIQ